MMPPSQGPMSLRKSFDVTWTIIAWISLGLSLASCVYFTARGFAFSHQVTCEDTAPTEFRQTFAYTGLVIYVLMALPALVLVVRKRRVGTIVAAVLATLAIFVPFLAFFLSALSSGMC